MNIVNILNVISTNSRTRYKFCINRAATREFTIKPFGGEHVTYSDELWCALESTELAQKVYDYVQENNITDYKLVEAVAAYVALPWYKQWLRSKVK